jgi:hypothetical protein
MLMKTVEAFRDRTVYTQAANGRWIAEFHGAVDIRVDGRSLERCRFALLDLLDEHVHEWLLSVPRAAHDSQASS